MMTQKVGSYWLDLEETSEATKFKEGKFEKILPQNRLQKTDASGTLLPNTWTFCRINKNIVL